MLGDASLTDLGPCVIVGAIPVLGIWLLWRWIGDSGNSNPDLCEKCGYDLRKTPARCPECGHVNNAYGRYVNLRRLREEWPANRIALRELGPDELDVEVYQSDDSSIMKLVVEHLQMRGIRCNARKAAPLGASGTRLVYGSHKLRVWSEDAERARIILTWLLEEIPAERARIVPPPEVREEST